MTAFPTRAGDDGPARHQVAKLRRLQHNTDVEVAAHELRKWRDAAMDAIDSQALAVALEVSLDAEVGFLEYAQARGGGSPVVAQLAADKLILQKNINNRRIARRFSA